MIFKQLGFSVPRGVTSLLLTVVLAFQVQLLTASTIQIQFSGLDIEYDGTLLTTIGDLGDTDDLNTVNLLVDGSLAGPTLIGPSDAISVEFSIGVEDIPVGGGPGIISDPIGSLSLVLKTGGLELTLEDATVNYLPTGFVDFVFTGSLGTVTGQDLPYGLTIGEDATFSFSAQIASGSLSHDSTHVTGFTAAGTGEISGELVPEPTTIALAIFGLIGMGFCRCKQA